MAEPATKKARTEEPDNTDAGPAFNAGQLCNMLAEMLTAAQKGDTAVKEMIPRCFGEGILISDMLTGETLISGKQAILKKLFAATVAPDEVAARVLIEEPASQNSSFAVDIYDSAKPRTPFSGFRAGSNVVLVLCQESKIQQVWMADDAAASEWSKSLKTLKECKMWVKAMTLIAALSPSASKLDCHYNNYKDVSDPTNLGIGNVSAAESWQESIEAARAAQSGAAPSGDDLQKATEAFEKVTKHLSNDAKFKKAANLFCQILGTHLTKETAQAAFEGVKAAVGSGERMRFPNTKNELTEVMKIAWEKRDILVNKQTEQWALLESWRLGTIVAKDLTTDDSFAFAKHAKVAEANPSSPYICEACTTLNINRCPLKQEVLQELEKIPTTAENKIQWPSVEKAKGEGIFTCLTVMQSQYYRAWARAPVNMCFKVLTDPKKRAFFKDNNEKVSDLMAEMQKKNRDASKADSQGHYLSVGFQHGKMGW